MEAQVRRVEVELRDATEVLERSYTMLRTELQEQILAALRGWRVQLPRAPDALRPLDALPPEPLHGERAAAEERAPLHVERAVAADLESERGAAEGWGEIPCARCVGELRERPHRFSRRAVLRELWEGGQADMRRRGRLLKAHAEPMVACANGHGSYGSALVAGPAGFEAIVCPECVRCRSRAMHAFSFAAAARLFRPTLCGELRNRHLPVSCPACARHPLGGAGRTSVRALLAPDVFLSHHWGYLDDATGDSREMAHARAIAGKVFRETSDLVWVACQVAPLRASLAVTFF